MKVIYIYILRVNYRRLLTIPFALDPVKVHLVHVSHAHQHVLVLHDVVRISLSPPDRTT